MTFDEIYLKHFPTIVAYCYSRNGLNRYFAEEATSKAFDVLYRKWDTLQLHDEIPLKAYLFRTAEYTMKEVAREQPPDYEPLDNEWYQEMMEQEQRENGAVYDPAEEAEKFLGYANKIEKKLKKNAKVLFHYVVVEKLSADEIAKRMNLTENAVRIRWWRLRQKLMEHVKELPNCKQNVNVLKK